MLNHFSDELLSAYLDGEVTPVERAEIERQLEDSLDLRERLAVLTEVSQQVRMLKRPYAPPEIRAGVEARIHQLPRPLSPGNGVSVPAGLKRWVNWLTVASAATLLLVAGWAINRRPAEQIAALDPVAVRSVPTESMPARKATADLTQSELSMSIATQNLEKHPLSNQQGEPVQIVNVSRDEIRQQIAELGQKSLTGMSIDVPGKLQEGDGDIPIVVVFTVVDVREAMNQMQVLLQQQQVRSPDNQVLVLNRDKSDQSHLTAVTMQLEMDGPEMAAVLNSVAAFDAVMYVDHNANLQKTDQQSVAGATAPILTNQVLENQARGMAFSKSSGPTAFSPDASALNEVSRKRQETRAEKGVVSEQRQFNFEQLMEQPSEKTLTASASRQADALQKGGLSAPASPSSGMKPARPSAGQAAVSQDKPQIPSAPAEHLSRARLAQQDGIPQEADRRLEIADSQNRRLAAGAKQPVPAKAPGWEEVKKIRAFILLKQHSPEPLPPGR